LQQLVDAGVLLEIDLAYAKTQVSHGSEKEAAVFATLLSLARKGHLCLDPDKIEELHPVLQKLLPKERKRLYLPKYEAIEDSIVTNIKRILSHPCCPEKTIEETGLTQEQKKAVENAIQYPLSLITGGPGTGKTFTAKQIVEVFQTSTLLMAPTGRAASHLEDKVSASFAKAGTLHSFLQVYSPLDYQKEVEELEAELVIVDECSMIDPFLFGRLLASIGPHTHLVLMGDCHQLPAVEGGSVFADLIDSHTIPLIQLKKCMRSDRTEILDLAKNLLEGNTETLCTIDLGFAEGDLEKIYQKLWAYTKKHFPKDLLQEKNRFQILSTLRKGPLGVEAINAYLYEKFSPLTTQVPILITRNDSRTGLCNGDTAVLIENKEAVFPDGRRLPIHELPPYEYAYCLSVHKSQGSEYDHVLFLVPEGSEVFGKEVLYTAVTRAKNKLDVEGNPDQMTLALQRSSRKMSGLIPKLLEKAVFN